MHNADMLRIAIAGTEKRKQVLRIRREVFIEEQGIAPEEEYDHCDAAAVHFLALIEEHPVGTVRLLLEGRQGRITRMAVLKAYRKRGIGRALLEAAINEARRRGLDRLYLHAQAASVKFYGESGFTPYGEPFSEVDIPHQAMERRL